MYYEGSIMNKMKAIYLRNEEILYFISNNSGLIVRPAFSSSEFEPFYNDSKWWFNGVPFSSIKAIIENPLNNRLKKNKYKEKDVLWARELWAQTETGNVIYKADHPDFKINWNTPAKMSMDKARIFFKVKSVNLVRIHDLKIEENKESFIANWNKSLKSKYIDMYRWSLNPWVWAYEVEKINVNWIK